MRPMCPMRADLAAVGDHQQRTGGCQRHHHRIRSAWRRPRRQPKPAAQFAVNPSAIGGPAPRIGEHSREVLRELAYSDAEIEMMVAEKAVRVAAVKEHEHV
jgi:crotonobetainyl-CoA:carnitine CoA-transferase CaiB-like acyl-CoA transferase